jgi:subtilase family serine protease
VRPVIDNGMGLSVGASRVHLLRFTIAVGAAASLTGLGAAPALAASPRARVGSSATLPRDAHVVRHESTGKPLLLTISLRSRDRRGLSTFSREVSTPGSAIYGDYLGVAQFAHRFGATPRAIQAVRSALGKDGLTVGTTMANGLTITATGTTRAVEQTFHTSIAQVQLHGGRIAFANVSGFSLPAAAARDVLSVAGLDNLHVAQPQGLVTGHSRAHVRALRGLHPAAVAHVATGGPQPCPAATTYAGEQADNNTAYAVYTADQIAAHYGFQNLYAQGDLGAGQTIALFEQQPYLGTDISTYEQCYGVNPSITPINVAGGPGPYQPPSGGTGGDDEAALDIEMLIGLAPAANIQIYQGPGQINAAPTIYSAIASADQAKVVSTSFGGCEQITNGAAPNQVQAEETIFQEMASQGQSVFSSSGDNGSESCQQSGESGAPTGLTMEDPGGDPFVTSVGGTSLFPTSATTESEYVWNENTPLGNHGASGGGLSSIFGMPSYQSGAAAGLGVINASSAGQTICGMAYCREAPDVSADADPLTGYSIYYEGAWQTGNGTSAASPLWAAFTALTNALPACRGRDVGFANPALYAIGGSAYAANFNDITGAIPFSGYAANNDYTGAGNGEYPTTAGYDMTTGLGTPIGGALSASLCNIASPRYTVAVASPGVVTGTVGTAFALAVHGSDSGNAALTYAASGLPAGLAINPATGVISGTPTTAQATTVTVSATDGYTNTGNVQFTVSIVNPPAPKAAPSGKPKASKLTLTGLTKRKPVLSFSLTGGNSKLKSLTVRVPKGLSFAKGKRLVSHITIKSGRKKVKFKTKLSKGVLTVTLSRSEKRITVVVTHPAISITRSEALKIKHKKVKRLVIDVSATNAKHKTSHQGIRLSKLK